MTWPQSLLQWPVVLYAILMVAGLVAPPLIFAVQRRNRARRRAAANLPPDVMMDYSERLAQSRWEAGLQAGAFVVTLVGVPLLLLGIEQLELVTWEDPEKGGLSVALLAMLIWLVWHGTDVARSFLGGLAFKTLATFQYAIQVGDRVTLKGYSGKIVKIGVFYAAIPGVLYNRVFTGPPHLSFRKHLCQNRALFTPIYSFSYGDCNGPGCS